MAIDKLQALGLPGRATPGPGSGDANPAPSPDEVRGFERMLEGGAAATGPLRPEGSSPTVAAAPAATAAHVGLGDRILGSLQSTAEQYSKTHERAVRALDGVSQLEVSALLQLQLDLVESTVRVELLSKLLSKSTQQLDQLTRIQ